jgi:hypothetical protein
MVDWSRHRALGSLTSNCDRVFGCLPELRCEGHFLAATVGVVENFAVGNSFSSPFFQTESCCTQLKMVAQVVSHPPLFVLDWDWASAPFFNSVDDASNQEAIAPHPLVIVNGGFALLGSSLAINVAVEMATKDDVFVVFHFA